MDCNTCRYNECEADVPPCEECNEAGSGWRSPNSDVLDDLGVETVTDALSLAKKLKADLSAAKADLKKFKHRAATANNEVEQILGKALGAPQFYPDVSKVDDGSVCVCDHTPATLAAKAAKEISGLKADLSTASTTAATEKARADQWKSKCRAVDRECTKKDKWIIDIKADRDYLKRDRNDAALANGEMVSEIIELREVLKAAAKEIEADVEAWSREGRQCTDSQVLLHIRRLLTSEVGKLVANVITAAREWYKESQWSSRDIPSECPDGVYQDHWKLATTVNALEKGGAS